MEKICLNCESTFTTKEKKRKYCSLDCYSSDKRRSFTPVLTKTCSGCKVKLPIDAFYIHTIGKSNKPIYKSKCKSCELQKRKNNYHSLPVEERQSNRKVRKEKLGFRRMKNYRLRHLFGISIDEYEEMVKKQNNLCYICSNPPQNGLSLGVDHNHITGKIRKLLCVNCNTMIGHSKENITILERTIEYIKSHAIIEDDKI